MKTSLKLSIAVLACMIIASPVRAEVIGVVETQSKVEGQCKAFTPGQIIALQQSLASRGFYQGPVDGVWTKETLAAVQAYQASRELSPTGELTTTDLEALGLDVSHLRKEDIRTIEKVDIRKHGNGPNARGWQAFQE